MASKSTVTSPTDIDLDALIQSLPACKRCRDHRRGCDTLLPKCRQCSKAGADCVFLDHGKDEYLPRTYIAKLVDHVRELSNPQTQPYDPPAPPPEEDGYGAAFNLSPTFSGSTIHDSISHASSTTLKADSVASDQPHFDHHFAYAVGSYRYLGAQSCLVKSPRLPPAPLHKPVRHDEDGFDLVLNTSTSGPYYTLVQTYLNVIHPLYPIIDPTARYLQPQPPDILTPVEIFTLNMVYSIACYLDPSAGGIVSYEAHGRLDRYHIASDKYRCLATNFFNTAMEHLEVSTVDPSIGTLRALLLLAINSLFEPKTGNIGQQVALASRLAISLEAESGHNDATTLRSMIVAIFCLENEIASTLDRPATFPEPSGDINFDESNPAEFLCSLYRVQHRFRKGDRHVKNVVLPRFDDKHTLRHTLCLTLHQTHFLLDPCWGTAWFLLEAAVATGTIHIFLTPHWIYRAGCILIQNMGSIWVENLVQLYSNALVVLELSSIKWPSTGLLRHSLEGLMENTKSSHLPSWKDKQIHYDVRI